jgi:hypothetical protein
LVLAQAELHLPQKPVRRVLINRKKSQILILEKGATRNSAIRQLYPDQKLTTANYKGFDARCEGLLCISDMTKSETIEYFDKVIADYQINIQFNAEVFGICSLDPQPRGGIV